ncbi:UNVERIFIED_CONTAM: Kirola [Sesamum calycinum]|uniref:Kirola n=1 Tax=Sesamum calycinum TaxID=2727403 RepID=A0AAW2J2N1_9LAMI
MGTVGSVIYWNYTHDGKERVAKEIIEAIDEEKKSVTFKVIEGDLMELYKTIKLTVHGHDWRRQPRHLDHRVRETERGCS